VDDRHSYISHTNCSGIVDALLMYSYSYRIQDLEKWFNNSKSLAKNYFDAITHEKGFKKVNNITLIRPGDIMAIRYLDKSDNTGHTMIIDQIAKIRKNSPL